MRTSVGNQRERIDAATVCDWAACSRAILADYWAHQILYRGTGALSVTAQPFVGP